jgi:hypothetical protein
MAGEDKRSKREIRKAAKAIDNDAPRRKDPDFDFYGPATSDYLDGLFGRHAERFAGREDALPNAFLIGAAKCGTTTLFRTLREHPEIHGSQPKEPKFFGAQYYKGWDWYLSLFEAGRHLPVRMEASVLYTGGDAMFHGAAQMIRHYIPDPKFLFVARDPMARIVSHWRHYKGIRPDYDGAFNDFFDHEAERRRIFECSLYWEKLEPYRRLFGDDKILCLTFEDMIADPAASLRTILDFLGVDARSPAVDRLLDGGQFVHANAADSGKKKEVPAPEWDPGLREKIKGLIRPDALKFLEHIGKPADYWRGIA